MPDQDEARTVKRLIKLIRAGIIKPKEEKPGKEEEVNSYHSLSKSNFVPRSQEEVFDAWADEEEGDEGRKLKGNLLAFHLVGVFANPS